MGHHERHTVPSAAPCAREQVSAASPAALSDYVRTDGTAHPFDAAEDRLRMQQNVGAFLAVVVIVALGGWLIDRLTIHSRTMLCLEAGHRQCTAFRIDPGGK